ncbi:MAG TPA: methylthioribulose 1-phosphate dehydratase [Kofleriaceae bacterium]|nr:methylthioribulose 1-phosphate dehydratase [Kofleriaceae bacterium]
MMSPSPADLDAAIHALVDVGRTFAARGSVPATSGNFSLRLDERRVAITRSGTDKGALAPADIVIAHLTGPPPPGASAETPLHLALYRDRPAVRAVIHTHADAAAVLSRAGGDLVLTGWELQKAFAGVTSHEAAVSIPVLPNDQDTVALAARVSARLLAEPAAPAYLLAGHGLYTWGSSLAEAVRHAVALEHLLACELDHRRLGALPSPNRSP